MIFAQTLLLLMLFVCILILIPGIRESEDMKERFFRGYETAEKASFFKTMRSAFKQRNFVASLLVFIMFSLSSSLRNASGIYFVKDVLRLPAYYLIFISLAQFLGFILFIPFWSNVIRKRGHVKTLKLGLILVTFSYLPGLWITTLLEVIIFNFLRLFFGGAVMTSLNPLIADVNDENTLIAGKHQEGTLTGIRTFFFRFALIFQAFVLAIVHYVTGYNPDPKAIQTPLAIWGIRIHTALIPFFLGLTGFIIMMKWYDLEREKTIVIKQKLKQLGL
jgi:Na+/melibiose symporter-like transporter